MQAASVASVSYAVTCIKVHCKVIEILAVRWLGMKLMQIFKWRLLQLVKASRVVSWERQQSQYNICFAHELNIVLEGLVRSENEAGILYNVENRLYFAV